MTLKEKVRNIVLLLLGRLLPKQFGIGSGMGSLSEDRKKIIEQAFMYTGNELVEGDYIEFGVARGRTMIFAYESMSKQSNRVKHGKLIGFDSFEGFPEPGGVDKVFERFKKGEENHGGIQITQRSFKKHGIDPEKITLVKGWYDQTLTNSESYGIEKARVVNIDCDMYESTILALRFLTPYLQQGTVLLFDDYLCYRADPSKGEQLAIKDWLNENKNISLISYRSYANVGQSFIVNLD